MSRQIANPESAPGRGELVLIDLIRQRATAVQRRNPALRLGIGDDCAILRPPVGHEILVTTDFSLEGRHFRRDWHSPESIGHRTLARGLSDLASMGAKPLSAFLSLALPSGVAKETRWVVGFLDGLLGLATASNVPLAGGDLSEAPSDHILADIVLLGSAPAGTALRRSSARAGDLLYCTGALGGAATELRSLSLQGSGKAKRGGNHPHLFPAPRLRVGEILRAKGLATACIDLSDGLSTDLAHLCDASSVNAEIEARQLPLNALAAELPREDALRAALHGGEDYELLFTAKAGTRVPRTIAGVPITRIGAITSSAVKKTSAAMLINDAGHHVPLERGGWEHLR